MHNDSTISRQPRGAPLYHIMRALAISLTTLILIAHPSGAEARGVGHLASLASQLTNMPAYGATAHFEVLLPSAREPVQYDMELRSAAAPADSLAPCQYLIEWTAHSPKGPRRGFSAYFDGNHYRYRNERLQEYHASESLTPFQPRGAGSQLRFGVQCQAQFADLLPQFLGAKLQEMVADTAYQYTFHADTLIAGRHASVVEGLKRTAGYDAQTFVYAFDASTGRPLMAEIETSPGSISEQQVTVTYGNDSLQPVAFTEEGLMERWPEVFEKYRQDNFRAEHLVGSPLPAFSCPELGGERYTHHRGDALERPTLIAVIDPAVASAAQTMAAVRQAVALAPRQVDVVWALATNRADEAAELAGSLQPGERALTSAGQLARSCGVALYPTLLLVKADGTVADVITGHNNDLASIVIQKISVI